MPSLSYEGATHTYRLPNAKVTTAIPLGSASIASIPQSRRTRIF